MEKGETPVKTYSKQELARLYGVDRNTFSTWIKKFEKKLPFYSNTQQLMTPAQVKVVFEHLGEP